ncbi:MAG: sulfur carrier protein ThiS [Rickettsiales bacterium]|nr:sulfur carrier protein ThiS [Rickettsiales bacterium]
MSKIKITLNGEEKEIRTGLTVRDLVEELELDLEKIAVEKDLEIVNVDEFEKVMIDEGSQIEIVHFIGGG